MSVVKGPGMNSDFGGKGAFHMSSLGRQPCGTNAVTDPKQTSTNGRLLAKNQLFRFCHHGGSQNILI